jgi:hypothetical protein
MLRWSLVISSPIFWHLHSSSSPLLAGFRGRVRFSNGQRRSLVVGLELFDFYCSVQLGISSSQLPNSHIFQRGRLNQQPVYKWMISCQVRVLYFWRYWTRCLVKPQSLCVTYPMSVPVSNPTCPSREPVLARGLNLIKTHMVRSVWKCWEYRNTPPIFSFFPGTSSSTRGFTGSQNFRQTHLSCIPQKQSDSADFFTGQISRA